MVNQKTSDYKTIRTRLHHRSGYSVHCRSCSTPGAQGDWICDSETVRISYNQLLMNFFLSG